MAYRNAAVTKLEESQREWSGTCCVPLIPVCVSVFTFVRWNVRPSSPIDLELMDTQELTAGQQSLRFPSFFFLFFLSTPLAGADVPLTGLEIPSHGNSCGSQLAFFLALVRNQYVCCFFFLVELFTAAVPLGAFHVGPLSTWLEDSWVKSTVRNNLMRLSHDKFFFLVARLLKILRFCCSSVIGSVDHGISSSTSTCWLESLQRASLTISTWSSHHPHCRLDLGGKNHDTRSQRILRSSHFWTPSTGYRGAGLHAVFPVWVDYFKLVRSMRRLQCACLCNLHSLRQRTCCLSNVCGGQTPIRWASIHSSSQCDADWRFPNRQGICYSHTPPEVGCERDSCCGWQLRLGLHIPKDARPPWSKSPPAKCSRFSTCSRTSHWPIRLMRK